MKSNDKPRAVRIEIRAAKLAAEWQRHPETKAEMAGYRAHAEDVDPSERGLAGWLARQIVHHNHYHFAAKIEEHLASVDSLAPPPPEWQAKVLAECDRVDEQTRHDVAASVVRHDAFAPEDSASTEPWDSGQETPPAEEIETRIAK
jgi:hypothetical protein